MLRPYQWDAICAIWEYFNSGKTGNPVIAMPTGTGKSHVIGGFVRTVYDAFPNQRIMVLTHVKELIEQNHAKLMGMWPTAPAGIYSAGLNKRDIYNNVTFAGIGSVAKKPELFGHVDIIIIDEAHLVSPNDATMYQKFITALLAYNPFLKVIGLTATPYRPGQGMITDPGGLFTDICFDLTTMEAFNRLISEFYLSPLIPKKTELLLDVEGVHVRGGEFVPKELQTAVDKYEITEAAVRESMELGHDRNTWLTFTTGIEHTLHTTEILNGFGVSARCVHSGNKDYKMSTAERDKNILDFKNGEFQVLVNSTILTTGFDHPLIDLILVLCPSHSPGRWVQMLGRGTRPVYADGFDLSVLEERQEAIIQGGKENCMVLDFAGNTKRLGPINDPVIPKKKGTKGGTAPVKLCENITGEGKECNTWIHASVRWCPACGAEFVFKNRLNQGASTDDLIKGDLPITEEFEVEHITYSSYHKVHGLTSMKVSYYSGLRVFSEYVCFEHTGPAQIRALNRAHRWWKERTDIPPPETVADALEITDTIKPATSLRVWTNKKHPEIMAYCLDGTHFGRKDTVAIPSVTTDKPNIPSAAYNSTTPDFDDDIPF